MIREAGRVGCPKDLRVAFFACLMNKRCRVTIIVAFLMLGAALTFLPFREFDVNSSGRPIGEHLKWRLPHKTVFYRKVPSGFVLEGREYDEPISRGMLAIEIVAIVAGALVLCRGFRRKADK